MRHHAAHPGFAGGGGAGFRAVKPLAHGVGEALPAPCHVST